MNINNIFTKIKTFLGEVKLEMKRVNWSSKQEVFRYTIIVVLVSLVVAAFLGGLDILFQFLIEKSVL